MSMFGHGEKQSATLLYEKNLLASAIGLANTTATLRTDGALRV